MKQSGQNLTDSYRHHVYFPKIPSLDPCAAKLKISPKPNCTTKIGVFAILKRSVFRTTDACRVLGSFSTPVSDTVSTQESILNPSKSLCMPATSQNSYFIGVSRVRVSRDNHFEEKLGKHQNSQKHGLWLWSKISHFREIVRYLYNKTASRDLPATAKSTKWHENWWEQDLDWISASGVRRFQLLDHPKHGFDFSSAAYVAELISVPIIWSKLCF